MEAIWAKVIKTGYRVGQKSINSMTLTIAPLLVHLVTVILIITPSNSDNLNSQPDALADFITKVRNNLYFDFELHQQYMNEHIGLISLISACQITFLFLALKAQLKQKESTALKLIQYIKTTFSFLILSVLLCSFKYMPQSRFLIVKIISAFTILVSTVTEYMCEYLNFTILYKNLSKKDQSHDELSPKVKLGLKVLITYVVLKTEISKSERIGLSVLILVPHLILIWRLLRKKIQKYNSHLEFVNYLTWIFIVCYNLILLLQIWTPLIAQNRWMVLVALFIWSSLAFKNVLEYTKILLLIQPPELISNEAEAIAYIRLLYNVYENRHEPSNSILLLGLVKNHSSECTNASCICKSRAKVVTSNLIKDVDFFLKFIQLSIQELRVKFCVYSVDIACLAFEVQAMRKFPIYFYKADIFRQKNEHKKMSLDERFAMYLIENVALRQVLEKNSDTKISNGESMELLQSEKKIEECYVKLQSIVMNFANFYKYNARTHCGLDLLKKQLEQIYVYWIEIMEIFGEKKTEERISPELIYLIIFFYQNVFNLSFKTKPILKRLEMIYKRLESKEINQQKFNASIYSENGCILQSTLESNVFGLISKVSTNAPEVFKYPSAQSMLNMDVHRLLPRCLRDEHMRMIKKWLETGSFRNINKLQEAYCYNYNESLMRVLMRSQIAVVDGKISVFVGIIKVDTDNYMIVNKDHEIDSYGLEFGKMLVNECRFKSIENIIPNWRYTSQDISRQPSTIKAKLVSQLKKNDQKKLQLRLEDSSQYLMGMQVYTRSMCKEEFTVVRKLNSTKISESALLPENNGDFDTPESTHFQSSKMFPSGQEEDANLLADLGSTSSKTNESNFSVWMMLEEITNRASAGHALSYPLLMTITIMLSVLVVLILATIGSLFLLQMKGLDSFNQVIFADSAVSNNMQLLEIHYNNILIVGQHCIEVPDQMKCSLLQKTMRDAQRILGDLLVKDIQYLIKNQTFLGHRYFEYELAQVELNINGTMVPVSTYQFMQYFIRETKQILKALSDNQPVENYMKTIKHLQANWAEMKRINDENLKFYEGVGIVELNMCIQYAIILSVLYAVLVTLEILIRYYLLRENNNFVNSILTLFRRISTKINEELSEYYETLSGLLKIKDVKVLLKMQMPVVTEAQNLSLRDYSSYTNNRQVLYMGVYWALFIILTVVSAYKISEYNQLQKSSIITINSLMRSENFMFQNYFEMKSIYFYSNFTQQEARILYNQAINKLGTVQNQFVKTALDIIELASTQDVQLARQFSAIVINNVCQATKELLQERQYQVCKNMNLGMLEEGILVAMTFFQNAIFGAASKMREGKENQPQLFQAKQYQDLDLYFVYLLRIYQITQSKMISILGFIMGTRMATVITLVTFQVLLQIGSIVLWYFKIKDKKWKLAQSYGFMLIFPFSLIKESKFMQQQLSHLL